MRYWLIRIGAPSISISHVNSGFAVTSGRQPQFEKRDIVVYMSRAKRFLRYASIVDVKTAEVSNEQRRFVTTVKVDSLNEIQSAPDIEYLRYSLSIIWNLDAPERHFSRGYRLLPEVDFETIRQGEPFVARTGYYELYRALPVELAREFQIEELLRESSASEGRDFHSRLSRVYEFIKSRVLSVGHLVDQLSEQITSLGLNALNGAEMEHEIAFEIDGSFVATNIALQQELFSELDAACRAGPETDVDEEARDVVELILLELRQADRLGTEQRFEKIFGGVVR